MMADAFLSMVSNAAIVLLCNSGEPVRSFFNYCGKHVLVVQQQRQKVSGGDIEVVVVCHGCFILA